MGESLRAVIAENEALHEQPSGEYLKEMETEVLEEGLFWRKLKFWSLHCVMNAVPSYLIAVVWLGLWRSLSAQLAMLAAVVTFVLSYSAVTASMKIFRNRENLFSRALRAGLVVRMIVSLLTLIAVPLGPFLMFTPDLWCGFLASLVVTKVLGLPPLMERTYTGEGAAPNIEITLPGFLEVYATTILEGLILSFMLFILSFLMILILQMRDRKSRYMLSGSKPVVIK